MKKIFAKLLSWLPCLLLLLVATNHFFLVSTQNLSPWLGGGFGMFASTDVGAARWVKATAINQQGDETVVPLKRRHKGLKYRARALPNHSQLKALAEDLWTETEKKASYSHSPLSSIRIEVWRTHYDPKSLRPRQTLVTQKEFNFKLKK